MFEPLRQIFRSRRAAAAPLPRVPDGERWYVVGDIHGRLDLFEALIEAIEADDRRVGPARTTVALLGDLVDRGPASAGVVERARRWQAERKVRILAGNHEEMFLDSFDNVEVLRHFLRHGGRETVLSYGVDRATYNEASLEDVQQLMRRHVPQADREFIASFEDYIVAGDYLLVHAGIAPDLPLGEQRRSDMLWIREPFLGHAEPHSHVVVHGHTIFGTVDWQANRIGIDTGAFKSGRLTALVLEGDSRRVIQTAKGPGGRIRIEQGEFAE
jgi:serine/threonine protein phosphatase 1